MSMRVNEFNKQQMKDVFDKISFDFSGTRRYPWQEVVDFVEELEEKAASLDVGCGNGRHMLELGKKTDVVFGLDFSKKMLNQAKKELLLNRHVDAFFGLVQGDASFLPFKDNFFDYILCIATMHHLTSFEERIKCLNEMYRVMEDGSRALMSVWSIHHDRFRGDREEIRENDFDVLVEWRSSGIRENRFYHVFSKEELISHLRESRFNSYEISLSSGNYYVELTK